MIIKLLQNLVIFLLVLVIQVAVLPNIPGVSETLNFALVVMVFMSASYEFYVGIIYALILGLSLEMYSTLPYGLILVALLVTLFVINFISKQVLTNKSFYSLVGQVAIATLIYSMIILGYKIVFTLGFSQVFLSIEGRGVYILYDFLWRMIANVLLVALLFIAFHVSSRRFKAVFIDTTKS